MLDIMRPRLYSRVLQHIRHRPNKMAFPMLLGTLALKKPASCGFLHFWHQDAWELAAQPSASDSRGAVAG